MVSQVSYHATLNVVLPDQLPGDTIGSVILIMQWLCIHYLIHTVYCPGR